MKTRAERIADVVTMMGEAWRQKITPATMLTFSVGTEDIPIEAVERGVMRAIRECQFMPSVHELRTMCGAISGNIATKDRPTLAWCDVRRAISRVGGYDSPQFNDPIINATIREMGGWVLLCESTVDELVWREKDFLRLYSALATCQLLEDRVARLAGITEKENGLAVSASVVSVECLTMGPSKMTRRIEAPKEAKALPVLADVQKLATRLEFKCDEDRQPTLAQKKDEQLAGLRRLVAEKQLATRRAETISKSEQI